MCSSQKLNTKRREKFNSKKAIENLTRVFIEPIVVHGLTKREEIPERLRESIRTARMTTLIQAYKEGKEGRLRGRGCGLWGSKTASWQKLEFKTFSGKT